MKNSYRYGKMNCDYQGALTGVCYTGMWNLMGSLHSGN